MLKDHLLTICLSEVLDVCCSRLKVVSLGDVGLVNSLRFDIPDPRLKEILLVLSYWFVIWLVFIVRPNYSLINSKIYLIDIMI